MCNRAGWTPRHEPSYGLVTVEEEHDAPIFEGKNSSRSQILARERLARQQIQPSFRSYGLCKNLRNQEIRENKMRNGGFLEEMAEICRSVLVDV